VDGNPVGVAGAQVDALIQWGDGTNSPITQTTGTDGLAVFFVPIGDKEGAMNKLSLATFTFSVPGTNTCKVDNTRPTSFVIVDPVATPTPTDNNNGDNGNGNPGHNHNKNNNNNNN
jgi:hypothetical protein